MITHTLLKFQTYGDIKTILIINRKNKIALIKIPVIKKIVVNG